MARGRRTNDNYRRRFEMSRLFPACSRGVKFRVRPLAGLKFHQSERTLRVVEPQEDDNSLRREDNFISRREIMVNVTENTFESAVVFYIAF